MAESGTNLDWIASTQEQSPDCSRGDWSDALRKLADIAADLGAERITDEASELAQRVSEGRFYVACVGQFKRGKSTLIDALVGDQVLPTGVIPVTTVPTVLRYGETKSARIRARNQWSQISPVDLEQYVSEEHNPENAKQIEGVEVFVPSLLLRSGMCLVDTPGLGSVFSGNTAATEAFIPHIDAAIVVVGADPPLSGDELNLVETVSQHVREILVVLNKSDRVTDAERAAATAFTRKMLDKRLQRPVEDIFEVSAIERLKNSGPTRDWNRLLTSLEQLVTQSGSTLIRRAGQRGVERLSEQVLAIISQERDALLRPLEESEHRIATMRQTLADAERSMRDLGYLFTAEQTRLHDMFLTRRKEFLDSTHPLAHAQLREWIRTAPHGSGPSFRRHVMQEAQEITRARVLPWLQREQEHAEQVYRQATRRFVDLANDFLRRLAEAGMSELSRMPHALDPERGFRTHSRFHFYAFITIAQPASPLLFVADLFLGLFRVYAPIERDAGEFLERLLEVNTSRVQNDIDERVVESRHGLEADIRILLREVGAAAERALEHAKAARAAGTTAVQTALRRLENLERRVKDLDGPPSSVTTTSAQDLRPS
jgi:GTPase Era involved in 16S rRNA processing